MPLARSMACVGLALMCMLLARPSTGSPPADPPTAGSLIESTGSFVFTDGSSFFRFSKGGAFEQGPLGISGRTVEGTWSSEDGRTFVIEGKWSWVNGVSRDNDYRRMKIHVSYRGEAAVETASIAKMKAYPCYFTIEELGPIEAP